MIKNYDNITKRCLFAVTDDKGAPGPLTNNQGAPEPLTNNLGLLTDNQGAPSLRPGGPKAPN